MKKSIRVEIDETLHTKCKMKSAALDVTITDYVREALRKWVEEEHPIILLPEQEDK